MAILTIHDPLSAMVETYLTMSTALGGACLEVGRDPTASWAVTTVPLNVYNRVMRPRLPDGPADSTESARTEARIRELVARFDRAGVTSTWWLDPDATPTDLPSRLLAAGYVASPSPSRTMSRDLDDLPAAPLPPGAELVLVNDRPGMAAAQRLGLIGNGVRAALADQVVPLLAPLADPGSPVRTAIIRAGGRPVASATSVLVGSDVGIYTVATVPEMQHRGYGRAITIALLADAKARGATQAVLDASEAGRGLYLKLGFRDDGVSRVFWRRAGGSNAVDRIRRHLRH